MADPRPKTSVPSETTSAPDARSGAGIPTNDLAAHQAIVDGVAPWSGDVPEGYLVDFVGALTDVEFRLDWGMTRDMVPARRETAKFPYLAEGHNGEGWFEVVNWIEAAFDARETFVAMTLGACYGAQAIGAYRAVQRLNPMPTKLVFVEPDPNNCAWIERHVRDNGLDPDDHWLIRAAVDDKGEPVLFTIGAPGAGAQSIMGPEWAYRKAARFGRARRSLMSLLRDKSTGIIKRLVPGYEWQVEIKFVSAVTLGEILGPLERVDYLEADIQGAEATAFPPFMRLLNRKVRRIHLGTHNVEQHAALHKRFADEGWEVLFSYGPYATHDSNLGKFLTNDGVLTVLNPRI